MSIPYEPLATLIASVTIRVDSESQRQRAVNPDHTLKSTLPESLVVYDPIVYQLTQLVMRHECETAGHECDLYMVAIIRDGLDLFRHLVVRRAVPNLLPAH
jgi:hypothetical protein